MGQSRQREALVPCLGGLEFWALMANPLLVKENPHRHRAAFEPQRKSSFKNRAKNPKYPEKPPGPER
jgi:hypothetical protein